MQQIYILIIISFLQPEDTNIYRIPYYEVISIHPKYESCDQEIVKTHDYYLAKDIRKKKTKQRNPKFIYDNNKNKLLMYKEKNIMYFASCKSIKLKGNS